MKKFHLFLLSFLILSNNLFSQVRLDIWGKSKTGKTVTSRTKESKLPSSFESTTPDGKSDKYELLKVGSINVETSSGQKYVYRPKTYYSSTSNSVVTYNEKNGWNGFYTSADGSSYTMMSGNVKKDNDSTSVKTCEVILPNKSDKYENPKIQKNISNNTSNFTNTDYYNRLIPINKLCTFYIEVSYRTFQAFNGDQSQVLSYINNYFLGIKNLAAREGLAFKLNKIYINTTPDIYTNSSIYVTINNFKDRINTNLPVNPESHFKMLLDNYLVSQNGGPLGVGYLGAGGKANGFENVTPTLSPNLAVSVVTVGTTTSIETLPTPSTSINSFSLSIFVGMHELGHNLGSQHTHWCGWKDDQGNPQGVIDSCSAKESVSGDPTSCTDGGPPLKFSTKPSIMSYCANQFLYNPPTVIPPYFQLVGGYYKNTGGMFERGFDKYPTHAIRSNVNLSSEIQDFTVGTKPTVTTFESVTNIGSTSAKTGGVVSDTGSTPFLIRGILWSTSNNPTVNNYQGYAIANYGNLGSYNISLVELIPNTTYYVRAFATNISGVSYGDVRSFTTTQTLPPTIGFTTVKDQGYCGLNPDPNIAAFCPTNNSAYAGGQSINSYGAPILERGVLYSTSINLDYGNSQKVFDNVNNSNDFEFKITGLQPSTRYYVRAFVKTSAGIGYGGIEDVTTYTSDSVVFSAVIERGITDRKARFNTYFFSSGQSQLTKRGYCLSTNPLPTINDSVFTTTGSMLPMTAVLRGLNQTTQYYVRAFAVNSEGVYYSKQYTFTTRQFSSSYSLVSPGTNTSTIKVSYNHTLNSTSWGTNTVSRYGVVWSKNTPYPLSTSAGVSYSSSPPTSGSVDFLLSHSGSTPGQRIYFRSYYKDVFMEDNYGDTSSFLIPAGPVVYGSGPYDITPFSAKIAGNVVSGGGSSVVERGFIYSTSPFGDINTMAKVSDTTGGLGFFTVNLPLSPQTNYFTKAYCKNAAGLYGYDGTWYGFSTPSPVPSLKTFDAESVTKVSAVIKGVLLNDWNCEQDPCGTIPTNNPLIQIGLCLGDSANITVQNSTVINVSLPLSSDTFNITLTNLVTGKKYYCRTFGLNQYGYGYGDVKTFIAAIPATITTTPSSNISYTSLTSGGNVTDDGGSSVISKGVCYSTQYPYPTVLNSSFTTENGGVGIFNTQVSGLLSGTGYFIRAYVTTEIGTFYGNVDTIKTLSTLPTLRTIPPYDITSNSVKSGGQVFSQGQSPITERGIVIGFGSNTKPTIQVNSVKTVDDLGTDGLGIFNSQVNTLTPQYTYYIRAYATNSQGTSYGEPCTNQIPCFTFTALPNKPSVTTQSATLIQQDQASGNGFITSTGGGGVAEKGFVYSTSSTKVSGINPIDSVGVLKVFDNVNSSGGYSLFMTNLIPSNQYFFRAYARNLGGTGYGIVRNFTTSQSPTTISTNNITDISKNSVTCGGVVQTIYNISERGVCWNTSPNPTISNTKAIDPQNINGEFSISVTGLTINTKYYIRSYVKNTSNQVTYGDEKTFTTLVDVSTNLVTNVSFTTANTGGVISGGSEPITKRGIVFGLQSNPTITGTLTDDGVGIGPFTSNLSNLIPNKLYFVRAYGINAGGVSYGQEFTFTTLNNDSIGTPIVVNGASTVLGASLATITANVTNQRSGPVTSRGFFIFPSKSYLYNLGALPFSNIPRTTEGSGTGVFNSGFAGLLPNTIYWYRSYARNYVGYGWGNVDSLITPSTFEGGCALYDLSTYQSVIAGKLSWSYKFGLNPNCVSYTIKLNKYTQDPIANPNLTPIQTRILNGYNPSNPTSQEVIQSYIEKVIDPQPVAEQLTNRWFEVRVSCNGCSNNLESRSVFLVPCKLCQ